MVLLPVALAVLVGALSGCGGDDFEDRTALVTIADRTTTFELDSCGLDEETVFVVGRDGDGALLQAVVGVTFADDDATEGAVPDEDAVPDSTGVTVEVEGSTLAASGAESWQRRGQTGPAPGLIGSAEVRGARIQVDGQLVGLDVDGQAVTGSTPVDFSLDARCDDTSG